MVMSCLESTQIQQDVSNEKTSQKQDSQNEQQRVNGEKENTTQSRGSRDGRANAKKKKLRTPKSTGNASETAVEHVSNSDPSGSVPSETDSAAVGVKESGDAKSSRSETANNDSNNPPVVPRATSYFTHDVRGKTSYGSLSVFTVEFQWNRVISPIVRRVTANGNTIYTERRRSVVVAATPKRNQLPKHSRLPPTRSPRGTGVTSVSSGVTWLAIVP